MAPLKKLPYFILSFFLGLVPCSDSFAERQLPTNFIGLARQCAPAIDPVTLAAIIATESSSFSHPWLIGINKGYRLAWQPRSKEEAIATAIHLQKSGYNFDAGLGQINNYNFARLKTSPEKIFNHCENIRHASQILAECYKKARGQFSEEQKALQASFSCYNTGNFTRGFKNGYVAKVLNANINKPGFSGAMQLAGNYTRERTQAIKPIPVVPAIKGKTLLHPLTSSIPKKSAVLSKRLEISRPSPPIIIEETKVGRWWDPFEKSRDFDPAWRASQVKE